MRLDALLRVEAVDRRLSAIFGVLFLLVSVLTLPNTAQVLRSLCALSRLFTHIFPMLRAERVFGGGGDESGRGIDIGAMDCVQKCRHFCASRRMNGASTIGVQSVAEFHEAVDRATHDRKMSLFLNGDSFIQAALRQLRRAFSPPLAFVTIAEHRYHAAGMVTCCRSFVVCA